ncbi:hydrolase [Spirochaetia bacterium]|nr:hydrolase [Spirochaetia bacterium]
MKNFVLKNGIAISPEKDGVSDSDLNVSGSKITASAKEKGAVIDLGKKSFIYPALINTHDHLRGNYLPRVGPPEGTYYLNWLPWDNDLKASDCYAERTKALPIEDGYLLSAYKTLFSGVVTVNDHFLHAMNSAILPTLPIRAITNYAIAHECSSYELKWGDTIPKEHKYAVKNEAPFITHLAEGFDEEAMNGIPYLESFGALDNHCLFVHCIGVSDVDIEKIAKAGASLSWCGASNIFMFNVTCKIRKFIKAGVNCTIGTDSSHTGSINLLDEIKYDRSLYQKMYGEDLPAKEIFKMITINSAKAFWMQDTTGTLEAGKMADILITKGMNSDPYENLINASMDDIELLTMAGKPIYGEERFLELLDGVLPDDYTMIKVHGRSMFVKGDPLSLYKRIREKLGFKKMLDFLPFDPEKQ